MFMGYPVSLLHIVIQKLPIEFSETLIAINSLVSGAMHSHVILQMSMLQKTFMAGAAREGLLPMVRSHVCL